MSANHKKEPLIFKRQNLNKKSCPHTCAYNRLHFDIKIPVPSAVIP